MDNQDELEQEEANEHLETAPQDKAPEVVDPRFETQEHNDFQDSAYFKGKFPIQMGRLYPTVAKILGLRSL